MKTRNARFWYLYRSGWVRLTLRPGQSLSHSRRYWNGEGYTCEGFTITHEGAQIREEWSDRGTDCDGRHSSGGELVWRLEDCAAIPAYGHPHPPTFNGEPIMRPDWNRADEYSRDYSAEAAGY